VDETEIIVAVDAVLAPVTAFLRRQKMIHW
jgi:hypothetical protein